MSALPPVPGVIAIEFLSAYGADDVIKNRLHWAWSGTPLTVSEANTLAGEIQASFIARLLGFCSSSFEFLGVVVTDLSSDTSARGESSTSNVGTRSGAILPCSVVVNIGYEVARRYRGGRPKSMVNMGVEPDLATAQAWTSDFVESLGTAWGNMGNDIAALTWSGGGMGDQVNVSYYQGYTAVTYPSGRTKDVPKLRTDPLVEAIINTEVKVKLGSARRRLSGGG